MYIYFTGVSTRRNRWDETPKTDRGTPGHTTPGQSTPGWAETPRTDRTGAQTPGATPTPGSKRRSRWDETPSAQIGGGTPMINVSGVTPAGAQAMQMSTPTPGMCTYFVIFAYVFLWVFVCCLYTYFSFYLQLLKVYDHVV